MSDFLLIVVAIGTWELARLAVTNARRLYWEQQQVEQMEECPNCFTMVPNLEYHRPRCPKKARLTHLWRKAE
jgi:hypothetical protein